MNRVRNLSKSKQLLVQYNACSTILHEVAKYVHSLSSTRELVWSVCKLTKVISGHLVLGAGHMGYGVQSSVGFQTVLSIKIPSAHLDVQEKIYYMKYTNKYIKLVIIFK